MEFNLIFVVLIGILLTPAYGWICPDTDVIDPCSCFDDAINCTGPEVTQTAISRALHAVRGYNSIPPHEILTLSSFKLSETRMEELDLTPLINVTSYGFYIQSNSNLTTIVGPGWPNEGLIDAVVLNMGGNRLTDEGLGESLKYFAPSLKALLLYENSLKGSSGKNQKADLEFLPGLSDFVQLQHLDLSDNQIRMINNAKFRNNYKLEFFRLDNNFNLTIGKNAFVFQDSGFTSNFFLFLQNCSLNETSINMQENGLLQLNRPNTLYLNSNQFEFIPEENFGSLLNSNDTNGLYMNNNPLICDERMKWLHEQKDKFEFMVMGANCTNDPGFDVFTTSLIN